MLPRIDFFANDMTSSSKNIKYSKKVNFLIMLIILPIIWFFIYLQ